MNISKAKKEDNGEKIPSPTQQNQSPKDDELSERFWSFVEKKNLEQVKRYSKDKLVDLDWHHPSNSKVSSQLLLLH